MVILISFFTICLQIHLLGWSGSLNKALLKMSIKHDHLKRVRQNTTHFKIYMQYCEDTYVKI